MRNKKKNYMPYISACIGKETALITTQSTIDETDKYRKVKKGLIGTNSQV